MYRILLIPLLLTIILPVNAQTTDPLAAEYVEACRAARQQGSESFETWQQLLTLDKLRSSTALQDRLRGNLSIKSAWGDTRHRAVENLVRIDRPRARPIIEGLYNERQSLADFFEHSLFPSTPQKLKDDEKARQFFWVYALDQIGSPLAKSAAQQYLRDHPANPDDGQLVIARRIAERVLKRGAVDRDAQITQILQQGGDPKELKSLLQQLQSWLVKPNGDLTTTLQKDIIESRDFIYHGPDTGKALGEPEFIRVAGDETRPRHRSPRFLRLVQAILLSTSDQSVLQPQQRELLVEALVQWIQAVGALARADDGSYNQALFHVARPWVGELSAALGRHAKMPASFFGELVTTVRTFDCSPPAQQILAQLLLDLKLVPLSGRVTANRYNAGTVYRTLPTLADGMDLIAGRTWVGQASLRLRSGFLGSPYSDAIDLAGLQAVVAAANSDSGPRQLLGAMIDAYRRLLENTLQVTQAFVDSLGDGQQRIFLARLLIDYLEICKDIASIDNLPTDSRVHLYEWLRANLWPDQQVSGGADRGFEYSRLWKMLVPTPVPAHYQAIAFFGDSPLFGNNSQEAFLTIATDILYEAKVWEQLRGTIDQSTDASLAATLGDQQWDSFEQIRQFIDGQLHQVAAAVKNGGATSSYTLPSLLWRVAESEAAFTNVLGTPLRQGLNKALLAAADQIQAARPQLWLRLKRQLEERARLQVRHVQSELARWVGVSSESELLREIAPLSQLIPYLEATPMNQALIGRYANLLSLQGRQRSIDEMDAEIRALQFGIGAVATGPLAGFWLRSAAFGAGAYMAAPGLIGLPPANYETTLTLGHLTDKPSLPYRGRRLGQFEPSPFVADPFEHELLVRQMDAWKEQRFNTVTAAAFAPLTLRTLAHLPEASRMIIAGRLRQRLVGFLTSSAIVSLTGWGGYEAVTGFQQNRKIESMVGVDAAIATEMGLLHQRTGLPVELIEQVRSIRLGVHQDTLLGAQILRRQQLTQTQAKLEAELQALEAQLQALERRVK